MAKSIEPQLALLQDCEANPDAQGNEGFLRQALRHRSCHVVERAARIAGAQGHSGIAADLTAAFERFLKDGAKKDPGCRAKTGILEALRQLGYCDADFFLRNIDCVQFEGRTDTAAELRVLCGFALLEIGYPAAMRHVVDLLADPQAATRAGAARAIAWARHLESEYLLRLKVHVSDERPEVLGECFLGLLTLKSEGSLSLVVDHLARGDEVAYEAAIALGESRRADALEPLTRAAEGVYGNELRRVAMTAITLLRIPDAVDYLLNQVSPDDPVSSVLAIEALAQCGNRDSIRTRLTEIIDRHDNRQMAEAFRRAFGTKESPPI